MTVFDEELQQLNEKLLRMCALVEEAIKYSIRSLVERDNVLAHSVIENDRLVDGLDLEIDEESIRLIALRQPTAGDLRFITTAMKITTDLERMGDLAVDIAERAIELNEEAVLKPYVDIPRMTEIVQEMTRDAIDAFVRRDAQRAAHVIARDDEIDSLKVAVIKELSLLTVQDPNRATRAMKISFVAHYLERIADHATNIAEMVIYLVEGKIVKHPDLTRKQIKVLFVCIHNSARSQMAEAFLNRLAGDRFLAQSAGLEPGVLNPLVVEVMREADIDIAAKRTKSVFDFYKQGALFDYVITVCDEAGAERCPIFPGITKRLHWSFADPAALQGSREEILEAARRIRDDIRQSVLTFIKEKRA